jgi:cyclic lactone autoinducer peptide
MVAKIANKVLTKVAQVLAGTGCVWYCHREEIPNELL